MMDDEAIGGCSAGETKVFEENLPQCSFLHHKSHMTRAQTWATSVGSQ
jgi:hypothetical protein